MSNRSLQCAVAFFVMVVIGYAVFFLYQPTHIQSQLKELHTLGLAVPAALLAYLFQLRLSRLARLDAWVRAYVDLIQEIRSWNHKRPAGGGLNDQDILDWTKFGSRFEHLCDSLNTVVSARDCDAFFTTGGSHLSIRFNFKFVSSIREPGNAHLDQVNHFVSLSHIHISRLYR